MCSSHARTYGGASRPRPDLRLSDADREHAISRLGDHYAVGRLDKEEFDERSDAVWTAKTGADLAPIFADLGPIGREPSARDTAGPWGPSGRRGWFPLPFLPLLFVLIALTVLTHIPFVLLAFAGLALVLLVGRRRRSVGVR